MIAAICLHNTTFLLQNLPRIYIVRSLCEYLLSVSTPNSAILLNEGYFFTIQTSPLTSPSASPFNAEKPHSR